mgnify:CR=1 FL=1
MRGAFDHTMPLRLENVLNENIDLTNLLKPLIVHQKVCKAFHVPRLQNAQLHGLQLPPMHQRDQLYE